MTLIRFILYNLLSIITICLIYYFWIHFFEFKLDKVNILSIIPFIASLIALNIHWIRNLIIPLKVSCTVERYNSEICLKVVFSNTSKIGIIITDIQMYGYTNTISPILIEKESIVSHHFNFKNISKYALEGKLYLTVNYYYPSNNIKKQCKLTFNE